MLTGKVSYCKSTASPLEKYERCLEKEVDLFVFKLDVAIVLMLNELNDAPTP